MGTHISSDSELIQRLQQGDENALAEVIHSYTGYVGKIVWNIIGDSLTKADAEEIIADVFVSLWKNAALVEPNRLKGYLATIARNKAIDAIRRAKIDLPLEEDYLHTSQAGPDQILSSQERNAVLRSLLNQLPEPDRSIFIRHYYLYQASSKISKIMHLNMNTVQSKLRRGREKLRKILEEGGYFDET